MIILGHLFILFDPEMAQLSLDAGFSSPVLPHPA